MFGMSLTEILLILLVALLVLGPERLPEAARTLGTWFRKLRRMSNVFRETLMLEEDRPHASDPRWPGEGVDDTSDDETPAIDPGPIDQRPIDESEEPPSTESTDPAPNAPGAVPRREIAGIRSVELEDVDASPATTSVLVAPPEAFEPARSIPLPLPALPHFY